jgi:hypothetical protein
MVKVITCKLAKEGSSALAGPHTRSKEASSVSALCCFHHAIKLTALLLAERGIPVFLFVTCSRPAYMR